MKQKNEILSKTLPNGLVVLAQHIPHIKSAAYDVSFPGGLAMDDKDALGASLILAELTSRGTKNLNSRALSDAFDFDGIRHSESAGFSRYSYRGSLVADKIDTALTLVRDMILDPSLPKEEVASIKDLYLQDLISLKDNPSALAMIELQKRYLPEPFCRSQYGEESGIEGVSYDRLKKLWDDSYAPSKAIVSVAGAIEPERIFEQIEALFSRWEGEGHSPPEFTEFQSTGDHHVPYESAQQQIVFAYPSAPFLSKHYYTAKVVNGILSGGMFGRLFIEVREKRGLCYSVYSKHAGAKDYGMVTVYAGTTPERAHETLSVILEELNNVSGNIEEKELSRAKTNLLSGLIMSEESAASRSVTNSSDWYLTGKLRTLEEIREGIESVTVDDISDYLSEFPPNDFSLLTLGKRALTRDSVGGKR